MLRRLLRLWDWWFNFPGKEERERDRDLSERTAVFRRYLREFIEDPEFPEPIPGFDAWEGREENVEETVAVRDRIRAQRAAVRAEREAAAREAAGA